MFIDSSLTPSVVSSNYHPIIISDHAPLTVDMKLPNRPLILPQWRFNSLLLSDSTFNSFIISSVDDFIMNNNNDSISASLLWESLKAFLRGQIISFTAHRNKMHKLELQDLLSEIADLDNLYATNPTPVLQKRR